MRSFVKWIPRNLGWKLGSLLLAFLLWMAVSAAPDVVTDHASPIVYRNLAPRLLISGDVPESVHVEVRGSAARLTASNLADTVAMFDLSGVLNPGDQTFTISSSNLNLPPGVTFLRAVPSQLRLRFARLATKDVPVEIRLSGDLPADHRIASKSVTPQMLRIAGADTRVAAISNVQTDAIDMSGVTNSADYRVNAFVSDPQVRFESSPVVTVRVNIEKAGIQH